jgi:DNA-binding transcriptional ArsR family regulator
MTDGSEELIRRMEDLRKDMTAFISSMRRSNIGMHYDGMTAAFREQIGRSFLEQNRDAFKRAMGHIEEGPSSSVEAMPQMASLFDDAIICYEDDDINGAMSRLQLVRDMISKSPGTVISPHRAQTLMGVVDRAMEQMALTETLRSKVGRPMLHRSCETVLGDISPEEVERRLTPLSNATRLRIMAMLYTSPRSFTEMRNELGMQKGHLRFHLNKLIEAGYVNVDGRTHIYFIEERGFLTIEGLGILFSAIGH